MLTLVALPKPFKGHFGVIQRNAIRSWMVLRPACDIVLLGDDEGTAEVAKEFGLRHIPFVARNEYGTPLVNSIFEQAQATAKHRLLAYVNADIILFNDFLSAVRRIPFRRFLMVGQRWDFNLNEPLDFSDPDWQNRLRECVRSRGILKNRTAIDYFVFTSGLWGEIPPFAVGRWGWDNWLVHRARAQGAAVIDASPAVTAVHQNHDYSHIPEGGERETQRNLTLVGQQGFTLDDTIWALPAKGLIKPVLSTERLKRHHWRLSTLSLPTWRFVLMRGLLSLMIAGKEKRLIKSSMRFMQRFFFHSHQ